MIKRLIVAAFAAFFALPATATIEIDEVTSPGGISAWLVEDSSIPFVALEFWFVGGATLDAPRRAWCDLYDDGPAGRGRG